MIEWLLLVTFVVDSSRQLTPQVTRDERRWFLVVQVEKIGPVTASNLEGVTKSLCGNQPDLYTFALSQCVYDYRCSVCKKIDSRWIDCRFLIAFLFLKK